MGGLMADRLLLVVGRLYDELALLQIVEFVVRQTAQMELLRIHFIVHWLWLRFVTVRSSTESARLLRDKQTAFGRRTVRWWHTVGRRIGGQIFCRQVAGRYAAMHRPVAATHCVGCARIVQSATITGRAMHMMMMHTGHRRHISVRQIGRDHLTEVGLVEACAVQNVRQALWREERWTMVWLVFARVVTMRMVVVQLPGEVSVFGEHLCGDRRCCV